ncbi:hypothetical protein [Alkaliphilus sp. B6464]|nr:hypothetical protein [Alkaliphilus sp. B6464]QUH21467.1 hypothetical protein HYG84_17315 [Alkaliphilus sp. B6464]
MGQIVNTKIEEMVQGFKYIGDVLNQTEQSDYILANMHEKMKNLLVM